MPDIVLFTTGSTASPFFPTVLSEVEKGLKEIGYMVCPQSEAHTEMELEFVQEIDAGGNIKIYFLKAGVDKSTINIQRIKIYAKKDRLKSFLATQPDKV